MKIDTMLQDLYWFLLMKWNLSFWHHTCAVLGFLSIYLKQGKTFTLPFVWDIDIVIWIVMKIMKDDAPV